MHIFGNSGNKLASSCMKCVDINEQTGIQATGDLKSQWDTIRKYQWVGAVNIKLYIKNFQRLGIHINNF